LPGETWEIIFKSLHDIFKREKLCEKLVAYCADNANTNFGGASRKGAQTVFSKINNELPQAFIAVGCAAHIIHNTIQTGPDLLPLDLEHLKHLCEEAEIEYKELLGFSKTRWLALLPAVDRILKLFSPLKSSFPLKNVLV
jgi:hypothetical protein